MATIAGKRVLIVEDNGLIGEVIADAVTEAGGWPLGPVLTEREALDMINYNPGMPDVAILDVHLNGTSFEVAERLAQLGVPFIFASGNIHDIPASLGYAPVCEKPYTPDTLLKVLAAALDSAPRRQAAA
jgi:CheY-like chemotaxis protein